MCVCGHTVRLDHQFPMLYLGKRGKSCGITKRSLCGGRCGCPGPAPAPAHTSVLANLNLAMTNSCCYVFLCPPC